VPQPRCEATKVNGERCAGHATVGSTLCSVHLGLAPGRGAPTTLTPEIQAKLVQLLGAGNYVDVACAASGVPRPTFYGWMKRGALDGEAPEDERYREFRAAIERARAEGEAMLVTIIAKAARSSWQAAAWILERHQPERWERPSQRQRLELPAGPAAPGTDATEADPFEALDELAVRRDARCA
jgi:hypothetical protein